ncbi:MAG: twin-arginine translocation signal domain-containing protein [Opitutus sp.]|nr:twin-arginine translocation signal domain-containing protein [Opitutus sp.]
MNTPLLPELSRRDFVKLSAVTSGAAVLASMGGNKVMAATAGSDKIRVGVIGCGGRGRGAAQNCLESSPGVEIVAIGDLFQRQVDGAEAAIKKFAAEKKLNQPAIQKFSGFDNYEKVLATDIDMVILAAPPGFRPVHFEAAVNAGKHIFTEKPVAVDPAGIRQFLAAAKKAKEKRLAVVSGLQRRHQPSYLATMERIHGGDMGELVGGQCYWNGTGIWYREKNDPKFPELANATDLEWQCWNWYHWDWLSGDQIVEQHIHNIDVMNWAFGGPPVKFYGMGGRQTRDDPKGNIWDHFAVEMEYGNGARVMSMCRHTPKSTQRVTERIVGTKGWAHTEQSGEAFIKGSKPFKYEGALPNPYVVEHTDLIASIRSNNPLNESERVAMSTLTAIGGRMSAYTGREISWKWLMEGSKLDIFPKEIRPGAGHFPVAAMPGKIDLV